MPISLSETIPLSHSSSLGIKTGCQAHLNPDEENAMPMRAFQVNGANGPFERVEREIPQPPARHVRIKVQACGVCHSDSVTKEGLFPGITYPRVPGHEVIGITDAI